MPQTATAVGTPGSVPAVMGMGGADGPEAGRRRRLVASVLVLALLVAAGAVVLSTLLE